MLFDIEINLRFIFYYGPFEKGLLVIDPWRYAELIRVEVYLPY
jgi:hypothetical protein